MLAVHYSPGPAGLTSSTRAVSSARGGLAALFFRCASLGLVVGAVGIPVSGYGQGAAFAQTSPPDAKGASTAESKPAADPKAGGDPKAGAEKRSQCIGCHGIPGYKASFPKVYSVPMIAGQNAKYLEAALLAYRKGDRPHPTMRGIAWSLTDTDIADLAAYYAGQ